MVRSLLPNLAVFLCKVVVLGPAWVSFGDSGFLQQSKDMQLIGNTKLLMWVSPWGDCWSHIMIGLWASAHIHLIEDLKNYSGIKYPHLTWKHIRITQEDLKDMGGEKGIWTTCIVCFNCTDLNWWICWDARWVLSRTSSVSSVCVSVWI